MKNVHIFKNNFDPKKVLLLSDIHWDNPKCDRVLLKRHLDQAMEMDAKSIDVLLTAHKVFTNLDDKEKIDGVLESIQNVAPDDARVLNLLFV